MSVLSKPLTLPNWYAVILPHTVEYWMLAVDSSTEEQPADTSFLTHVRNNILC